MMDTFAWERPLPDTNFFAPSHRVVWREPVGVVAAVAPWNFPFEVTLNKLGPALAAGNTVVLKPAPDTPWNATRLGRLAVERTDMPPRCAQRSTDVEQHCGRTAGDRSAGGYGCNPLANPGRAGEGRIRTIGYPTDSGNRLSSILIRAPPRAHHSPVVSQSSS
jgi:hypothetical protein